MTYNRHQTATTAGVAKGTRGGKKRKRKKKRVILGDVPIKF